MVDAFSNQLAKATRLSVAPMMDLTDRHCRYLHRMMSRHTLLYTEMVAAPALVRGDALHLLEFNAEEHPVALQLGGSDPIELAKAARLGQDAGYDEINLNVGCPSDRVQSAAFGAILMKNPGLLADCCKAMCEEVDIEVTVKCRIGVDNQLPQKVLPQFLSQISAAGISRFSIHARKAWLQGLSPKENRNVPPLDYDLVIQMKRLFPELSISINGGITSLDQVKSFLNCGLDGVMIGRAAYKQPCDILTLADKVIFGENFTYDAVQIVHKMVPYIEAHLISGGKLNEITRHMLGLFAAKPGSRTWRRVLSERSHIAGPELVLEALSHVEEKT